MNSDTKKQVSTSSKKKSSTALSPEEKEIKKLKKKIKELEEQEKLDKSVEETFTQDTDLDIRPDKYIAVISLLPWTLNISTGDKGKRPYSFQKMFSRKNILYGDLVRIIDNHPTFAENGYFYILNRDVVRKHGLDAAYEKILDKNTIEKLLSTEFESLISVFKNANDRQKKVIANIVISQLKGGADIDKNAVYAISQDTGINILEKVEESKNFSEEQ